MKVSKKRRGKLKIALTNLTNKRREQSRQNRSNKSQRSPREQADFESRLIRITCKRGQGFMTRDGVKFLAGHGIKLSHEQVESINKRASIANRSMLKPNFS